MNDSTTQIADVDLHQCILWGVCTVPLRPLPNTRQLHLQLPFPGSVALHDMVTRFGVLHPSLQPSGAEEQRAKVASTFSRTQELADAKVVRNLFSMGAD